jgi:hypothetical protein
MDPLNAVTRLFPKIARNPAEFFVNVKVQGTTVPDASRAVNTPTTVPGGALLFTVKLLILMVIQLSDRHWSWLIGAWRSPGTRAVLKGWR